MQNWAKQLIELRETYRSKKDKMIKKTKEFITIKVRKAGQWLPLGRGVCRKDEEAEGCFWGLLGNVLLCRYFFAGVI